MSRPVRLAVVAASPVYYQTPLYRRVAADPEIEFAAIFASDAGVRAHMAGFGQPVAWDVDMLSGYKSIFLRRARKNQPGASFFSLRDWDIVRQILAGDYDVLWLHGYNSVTHTLAAVTQLMRRRPLLIREEQTLLSSRPAWKRTLKRIWLRFLFSRAYALCIGTANRDWFRHYGIPEDRTFYVPYCVDQDRLLSTPGLEVDSTEHKHMLRKRFGIPGEAGPVILSVGRMIEKKQPLFVIDAFKQVRRTRQCCLLLVGSGELEKAIRAKISTERIPDVYLTGFLNQTEVSSAYALADIFVLASKTDETWGVVINEAMGYGLPILASDKVGSSQDLVRHGHNGFVFPSNDVGELVKAMDLLVIHPELRRLYGAASREIIGSWNYESAFQGLRAALVSALKTNDLTGATVQAARGMRR